MEFSIEFINGIFEVTISGAATPGGYEDLISTLVAHERWRAGSLVLSEGTELETAHLAPEDVVSVAEVCGKYRAAIGASKFASIARTELVFGMNRMWGAYVETRWDAEANFFKNRIDAMEWLSA